MVLGLRFERRPERAGLTVLRDPAIAGLPTSEVAAAAALAIRKGRLALAARGGGQMLLIAPDEDEMAPLAARLAEMPRLRDVLVMTTPAAIRRMILRTAARALVIDATNRLVRMRPDLSARHLITYPQAAVGLLAVAGVAIAILAFGWTAVAAFNLLAGLTFLAMNLVKILSLGLLAHRARQRPPVLARDGDRDLPVYTVLLPLHDEAHMVAELVAAMERLDWPRDRLDIKLIVENGDAATLSAIAALRLSAPFETIRVPPHGPRTKPKALAFALPLARGRYVTVYDAEDRPDPQQLREAHAAFMEGDARLACVQAPLVIDNAGVNGLTALFALEYAVQFGALLPLLAALDLPLPLGGTSNHFRREILEAVGGWDPYNVTEDADLGIRLARFGYRAGMIDRPTLEEAPRTTRIWLAQRTRWLKGWMQTFLVHMRAPRRLMRDIGPKRFAGFMMTSSGALLAVAVHPVYLATVLWLFVDPKLMLREQSPLFSAMIFLNVFNFVSAYGVFALLSRQAWRMRNDRWPSSALAFLPGYWLLMSLACLRALGGLVLRPHHWSKTPHVGRSRPGARKPASPAPFPAGAENRPADVVSARV